MHALEKGQFEKARENHNRLLAMKSALLPSLLKNGEPGRDAAAEKLETLLSALGAVTASDLVAEVTPFLRLNIERCVAETRQDSGNGERLANYLLSAAFDAWFKLLPDNASLRLEDFGCDVLLPKLRARIPASLLPLTLRRASAESLEVAARDGVYLQPLATPERRAPVSDPTRRISGSTSAQVLLAPNHALVDDVSALESAAEDFDAEPFLQMMSAALEFIAAADKRLAGQIDDAIGWYVPVKTSDPTMHRSFTVEGQAGVIFLSEALDSVLLAEAIVHEFYHTVLHIVTETEDVFSGSNPAERFYSPWRDDPRPLSGLFHAIYVFSGVEDFYAKVRHASLPPARAEIVEQRRAKLHRQLRIGLAQLPKDRLPAAAGKIIGAIEQGLKGSRPRLENESSIVETMENHLKGWRQRNPELAPKVRMPI